jgi:hypothetical protein
VREAPDLALFTRLDADVEALRPVLAAQGLERIARF